MGYIHFVLRVLGLLIIVLIFTRLFMVVAGYIGKEFGIGNFFISLWEKITKLIKNR